MPDTTPTPIEHYDEHGRLTRAGAVHVIQSGGSVLVHGKHYNTLDKLPGEAEFAKGSTAAQDAARARLKEQQAAAQRELDALDAPAPKPAKPAAGGQAPAPKPAT